MLPIVTYNAVMYSIYSLSTSINSTQTVFNFILQHKDSDYVIFQNQLETTDLNIKLNIISALIKDIIKTHCINSGLSEQNDIVNITNQILNPKIDISLSSAEKNISLLEEYGIVDIKTNGIDIKLPDPVKLSLLSTLEIIEKINQTLEQIHQKIICHQKIYFKSIFKIKIHNEINKIIGYTHIFNSRLNLLFEILKIYKDIVINN